MPLQCLLEYLIEQGSIAKTATKAQQFKVSIESGGVLTCQPAEPGSSTTHFWVKGLILASHGTFTRQRHGSGHKKLQRSVLVQNNFSMKMEQKVVREKWSCVKSHDSSQF